MSRQTRSNKSIYIIAAIWAAAWLWNLRRFPMLAYKNWWGTFILALLISNIVIVLPLIIMETLIGQRKQACGPKIFAKLQKWSSRIQRLPIIATIFILMYYTPIMARGEVYLVKAFSGNFLSNPSIYFGQEILWITPTIQNPGTIQRPIFTALFIGLGTIALSLRKGLKSISNVLKYTVPIPFIILLILWIHGMTLAWWIEWVKLLFKPEFSQLANIELRQAAIGQSFFSASLAFGYFIFAWSHKKRKEKIIKSSIWILSGNFLASILSWIAVFSTIGFMAKQQGKAFFKLMQWWAHLIFSTLPTAISLMPFFRIGFSILLFAVVITLAISSIIAFFEVITESFKEFNKKYKTHKIMLIILLIVFAGTIPFSMWAGSYYLEITDHFVWWYIFIVIWILETLIINRYFKKHKLYNKRYRVLLSIIPILLIGIVITAIIAEIQNWYQNYPNKYLWIFGILPLIATIIISMILGKKQEKI